MTTLTGSAQGTVLLPFSFMLYTNDCRGSNESSLIKYSDDSAIFDLSNDDSLYYLQVSKFTVWGEMDYLMLNVSKNKELVIDFHQKQAYLPDLVIKGEKVERVSQYKYLGTVLDSKFNFNQNPALIQKKSRIYLLQKLKNLNVNSSVQQMFNHAFSESVLTSFLCWFGSLSVKNKNMLARVVNVCSKIVSVRQESLNELYKRRAVQKGKKIAFDSAHVLARHFELLPSGR